MHLATSIPMQCPAQSIPMGCRYRVNDFQNRQCPLNNRDLDTRTVAFVATFNFTAGRYYDFIVITSPSADLEAEQVYDFTLTATLDGAPSPPRWAAPEARQAGINWPALPCCIPRL